MFIQVLQGRCNDVDQLRKQMDLWNETIADGATGFLGSTGGVTDDGTVIAVVRFDSREHADANSSRPEQDAWWRETSSCFEGEPSFADYDDAVTMLGGGSDDAGFVQIIRGKVDDPVTLEAVFAPLPEEDRLAHGRVDVHRRVPRIARELRGRQR